MTSAQNISHFKKDYFNRCEDRFIKTEYTLFLKKITKFWGKQTKEKKEELLTIASERIVTKLLESLLNLELLNVLYIF